MTRPAEAIAAANAVIADRYATAAAIAAGEATRAAEMAVQPSRVQNVTTEFLGRAEKAVQTGEEYEQTLQASSAYGQMAGIASTAKFAAAAANATRYAADAAVKAGAPGAARRAERAAQAAAWWAEMAQQRAETSHYAPYTAVKTARAARRAAAAARYAARASSPLGRFATGTVGLAVALLPAASRGRWNEEWKSDLCHVAGRKRAKLVVGLLPAAVRLAVLLRLPTPRSRR
jgi:hypothetical protein